MSLYQVHYKAMRALLNERTFSVTDACPFAPMLRGKTEDLSAHRVSLTRQGVLLEGEGLCEEAQRALQVIACPEAQLKVTSFSLGSNQRTAYFLQGDVAVFARFDHQDTCTFSRPIRLERLAENLTKQLAPSSTLSGRPLRLEPALLRVFALWMDEGMRLQPPKEAAEAFKRSALSHGTLVHPLSKPFAKRAESLVGALLEHRFLVEEDGLFWFGPEFQAWYDVLSGDERVELQLRTLPTKDHRTPERGIVFVGSQEQRLGLWSQSESSSLWAFWPNPKSIRAFLRELLSCSLPEDKDFLESYFSHGVLLHNV
ncbi:MAG: hypothetical protein H6728_12695 [Myxococcales bacterium]|nr:hypothetical protein [Myxococcales bacterium]MCB9643926.1 hypothetical protein [Myxococcales bacterium]